MSALDASILEELHALAGAEAMRETIALFESSALRNLRALRERQQDLPAFARAAHSLRGSCAIIGARGMAELCAELEELARAEARDGLQGLLERLEREHALTLEALRELEARPRPRSA